MIGTALLAATAAIVLFLTAPAEYEFVRRLGGMRWEPRSLSPLVHVGAQPTTRFVFTKNPEQILKDMRLELGRRGWFDLNETNSHYKDWWTTFARRDAYQVGGFRRDRSDWINLSPTYNYEDYPEGTTCVVELCIEPSWMQKQIRRFREMIFGR